VAEVEANCRSAGWGCMDCKKALHGAMVAELTPIRARAAELQAAPGRVLEVLGDGAAQARAVARETMRDVRALVGLDPLTVSASALPADGAPAAG